MLLFLLAVRLDGRDMPFGLYGMDTEWPANLSDLAVMAYDAFLWPGVFIIAQLVEIAPTLALKLGIDIDGPRTMLPAALSLLVWSLLIYLVWRVVKRVCLYIYYNLLRIRTFVISTFQSYKAHKTAAAAADAMKKSEVVFDDLDVAVLNTSMALAPGLALSAPGLSGHLTQRPALIQRSLEKLKRYGLLSSASSTTEGYDNYHVTPSGAALISMWQRQDKKSE